MVAAKPEGHPPLRRAVSQPSFVLPAPLADDVPRRFFRTWVRAIPRRFVRGSELKEVLSGKVPRELLEQAQMLYAKYRDEPDGETRFRKSLGDRGIRGTRTWWMWMKMIYESQTDRKFSRADLERTMDPDEVELWLKTAEQLAPRGPLEEV
jgi:hypothetical protein